MIALSHARGFCAGNWQIFLSNNNLNAATDWRVLALTFFGAE
jgi:hypothetical protein